MWTFLADLLWDPLFYLALIPVVSMIGIHLLWFSDSRDAPDHNTTSHLIGLAVVLVTLGGAVVWQLAGWGGSSDDAGPPPLREMQTIEASLAVKKTKVTQPQKHFKEPDPVKKPEGVSHDEKKKPDPKPPDKEDPPKKADPVDVTDLSKRFHHPNDDDDPTGKPVTNIGDFNGSEHGFATETKGDPYFQALLADLAYSPPESAKDEGTPVGCIHLTPEGKIPETKFIEQTTGDYTTAARIALTQLQKTRNDKPQPVPDKLLPLTTKWLCFKFTTVAGN